MDTRFEPVHEFPGLRQLRMFEAVARLESVSRAAVELNRSQPAVTQALAKLESQLGVDLTERRNTGSYLTGFGRILLARTRHLFALIEQALIAPRIGAPFVERSRFRPLLSKITSAQVRCLVSMAEAERTVQSDVAPRTLQRSVRELEQIIGRRVTQHGLRGAGLSPAGVELAYQLRLALKEIEYAREEITAALGEAQTTISIGAMPQCATLVLASAIEEFVRQKPLAQIQVAHGPYAFLLNDLRMGKIDFLFGVLRKPEWATDVREEPLFDAPYAIIARKNHPLSRKKTIGVDDLANYDWIMPQRGAPRRVAFETMFDGGRRPRVGVETSRSDLQATLIGSSDRLTIMSAQEARRLAGTGKFIVVDYKPSVARGRDGIAVRTNWHPTAGNRLFLEIICKQGRSYSSAEQEAVVSGPAGRTGRSPAAHGSRRTRRERVRVRSAPYSNASGR